ncbi:MAG: glycosyltransferase family 2 protein, partial [Coprobacillaceae bacterium]
KGNESQEVVDFDYNPLISILIPVYNIEKHYLSECLDSILNQTYTNFEVCLVDDCSKKQETLETLKEYIEKDNRIKVHYRTENGHISKASNDALAMANGEFIALVDNDDLITENALYENVKALNNDRTIDMLYSDEDKLDLKGRLRDPHFKPDFSPDSLLSSNYICHFTVLRKSLVEKIGGFRVGYEGAQDYDLFLRFTEQTNKIHHIDKILYHWRMIEGSTAATIDNKSYAIQKGIKTLEDAMQRRGVNAVVSAHGSAPYYFVEYQYEEEPKISIIIPTRDYADVLEKCLVSLFKKTEYKNYEVIVVNNNSQKKETFNLFDHYKEKYSNFKVIDANIEFNYSKLNNLAVEQSEGEYIVLLNNDTEIISSNWLNVMVGYASQPPIGAVGPKLLYPDNTVQHGGVVLGVGGIANHAFLEFSAFDLGFYGRLAVPYNYSAVTAACLMISKTKFKEVGGLEEELMVAFNDVDFNMKLLEKGYYNLFVPQIELYHHESKSRGLDTTDEKYKRFLSEHDFMHNKWGNKLIQDRFYNKNLSLKKCFALDKREQK